MGGHFRRRWGSRWSVTTIIVLALILGSSLSLTFTTNRFKGGIATDDRPFGQRTESTTRRKMVRVLSVFLSLAVSSYGFSVNRNNVQKFHHLVAPLRSSKDTDINADSSGSSPVQDEFAFQDGVRAAGMGGYSVMRQPASRTAWDPKAGPEFELPVNLDEQKDAARQLDDDWWSNKFLGQPPQPPSSTTKASASAERQKQNKTKSSGTGTASIGKEPEELDLFQRIRSIVNIRLIYR
jgi:hypothetical protein